MTIRRLKLLPSLALAVLGLFVLAGPAPAADIELLTIAIGVDADTLNPQEQTTTLFQNMCDLMYDDLFYQDENGQLHNHLVEKYSISPDGLTYTLTLRQGVKFSDGTPYDAEVQKVTFDRALDPKMRVPLRAYISMIAKTEVVDKYTLKLTLKYPYSPLLAQLSQPLASPISPEALKKYGDNVRQNPVGAGPYLLEKWVKGQQIAMVRNENYWGKKATVKRIVWKIVPEDSTREAMLRSGQVDVCYKPSPANVKSLQADPAIKVAMPLDTRTIFMGLNFQKGVTKEKLVRQAFNYAVDKKAIVDKILFGTAVPMDGPMSPILFGYKKMDKQWDYNPEKAKELLKKANFDFNYVVKMRTPQGRYLFDKQVSEAIQAFLQDIGVKVELRTYDWPTYVAGLLKPIDKTELELFLLGWGPTVMDADNALYGQFHSSVNPPKGLGAAFYSNPEFDKLMEESRRELDVDKRKAVLAKAAEIVWDDCPWLWLHVEKFVMAYSSKIDGLVVTPTEKFYPTYITMK